VSWIGSLAQLFDKLRFKQPLDHRIEGAGTQADASVRPFSDVLEDGVAMAISIGQRDEDIKGIPRQRQETVRFGTFTADSSPGPSLPIFAIAINGIVRLSRKDRLRGAATRST
jgi:hypothetical protein